MTTDIITKRNILFDLLTYEYKNTPVNVKPRSPQKYEMGTDRTIFICYPKGHCICGVEPQVKNGRLCHNKWLIFDEK